MSLDETASALAGQPDHERPAALGELQITVTPPGRSPWRPLDDTPNSVSRLLLQSHTMVGSAMDELIKTPGDALIGNM